MPDDEHGVIRHTLLERFVQGQLKRTTVLATPMPAAQ
jgi:hypothetical protein